MEETDLYNLGHWENGTLYYNDATTGGIFNWSPTYTGKWNNSPDLVKLASSRPSAIVCPSSTTISPCGPCTGTGWAPGENIEGLGNYGLCFGKYNVKATGYPLKVECAIDSSAGIFVYAHRKPLKKVTDGTSKTIAIGEVKLSDNTSNWCPWAFGAVYESMRSTWNPINLLPGQEDAVVHSWGNENGSFGSEHPGGANFVLIDGHVEFFSDDIDLTIYRGYGTIAGTD
jgi:prepilin-type processing-associated H-X9-DG protein